MSCPGDVRRLVVQTLQRFIRIFALAFALLAGSVSGVRAEGPAVSSTAERLYAAARPKLLQIRTLLAAAGRQSSLGSGFLVSALILFPHRCQILLSRVHVHPSLAPMPRARLGYIFYVTQPRPSG